MNFKQRTIEGNYCEIYISELHFLKRKEIENCLKIIKYFTKGDKYFFGLFREDGNFDDYSDTIRYRTKIPEYFKNNGNYEDLTLDKFKRKKQFDSRISAIGSVTVDNEFYEMIPKICNYYLETMFFEPIIGWKEFELTYGSNTMQKSIDFIKNGYTDLIFLHVDSGSFYIQFNTKRFNPETVIAEIEKIIY